MQKAFKNLILFLTLIFTCQSAFCYTLESSELKKEIKTKVTSELKKEIEKYSPDYSIHITGIPNFNIETNENIKPKIEIISVNNNFQTNQYKRVLIKNSKDNLIKAFPINIQTKIYADVLVAKEIIPFNQEINSTNTILERKEISRYLGKTLHSLDKSHISNRNFQKGNIILSNYVKQKAAIFKDSKIDIVFISSKGLKITVRGQALKDGAIGETILVKSDKYNKTYNGLINSQNEVIVRI